MSSLITVTKNNYFKIFSRRKYKVLMAIVAIFSLCFALFSSGGLNFNISFLKLNFGRGSYFVLDLANSLIAPLLLFMLSSDFLSHEISDNTIKAELTRPVSRVKLYIGKMIAAFGYCATIYALNLFIGIIFNLFTKNMSGLSFITSTLISLIPLLATSALTFLIAVLVESPAFTMFLSMVIYAAISFLGTAFSQFSAPLYTNYTQIYKMFESSQINITQVSIGLAIIISTAVILTTIGEMIFDRKNYG